MLERTVAILLILLPALAPGCVAPAEHDILAELRRDGWLGADDAEPADAALPPAPTGGAELPVTGAGTLADLLRTAEARSPLLAAARSSVGVAAGQRWQASLYPNPRMDLSVEDVSSRDGASDAKTTVGFTQPIILGKRRQAAMDAASAEQAARLAEVEAQRRTLFGEIAAEHVRLVSIHEQQRLYGELRELASRTLTASSTRFEARAAPETDVIRPRIEVYRIDAALGRLAHESAATARRLGLLIGGITVDPARVQGCIQTAPAALDSEAMEATVRATHPVFVVADREIVAAAARLDRVRAERTPDLDVRVAAGYRGESDDGVVEFGAGMSLPLWDARQGDILSARFELMRARQQRAAIENDLLGRLAASVGVYEAARAQHAAFRDQIVPDAQRSFEQTGEGYRAGRASFLDLLDTQRTFIEARITLAELASTVAAARASIMQIVGPDGLGPDGLGPGGLGPGGLGMKDGPPGLIHDPTPEPNVSSSRSKERQTGAEVKP